MKKLIALILAIFCFAMVLCSCDKNNGEVDLTEEYSINGVYYEHYGLDYSYDYYKDTSFTDIVNSLFGIDNDYDDNDDTNYKNIRRCGDFVIADYYPDDNEGESDGVCIIEYMGKDKDIAIPAEFDGSDVTAIGAYEDYGYGTFNPFADTGFNSIYLPSTVKYIYLGALTANDQVFVPDDFKDDRAIPKEINVDPNNKYFCSENGILYSKDKSCLLCVPAAYEADELTIPDSVKYIAEDAIVCNNIKRINIGANVIGISYPSYIFSKKLEQINVSPNNEHYSSKDGVLFDKKQTKLLNYPSMKADMRYYLPDSVKNVAADWGYVLKTKEIVFNRNIEVCNLYDERPCVYSDSTADNIAWYSSIEKVYGYRGTEFDEIVYMLRSSGISNSDFGYEYID